MFLGFVVFILYVANNRKFYFFYFIPALASPEILIEGVEAK